MDIFIKIIKYNMYQIIKYFYTEKLLVGGIKKFKFI